MESLLQDVRFALRSLRRNPGFTTLVVLTLAIGIGASTAMFTLVDSVLVRPLNFQDSARLVMVFEKNPHGEARNHVSPANFFDWREQAGSFTELAATSDQPLNLTGGGEAEQIRARFTTANFFTLLGARPQIGRTYVAGQDTEDIVVLSDSLWRRRFGADPAIVDRTIHLNGVPHAVTGVMPADFPSVGGKPELWVVANYDQEWRGRFLHAIARLRPEATIEQAKSEMDTIGRRLAAAFPQSNANWGVTVVPVHEQVTGDVRPALLVLLGAVGLLLLIGCVNVANLMLSQAVARRRDLAVRLSLGASRARLIRRALVESILLSGAAGGLGILLAIWGTEALVRLLPQDLALPRLDEVTVDGRVLSFALVLSLLTGVLFGIAPALLGSSMKLADTLRQSMRGTTSARNRLRSVLVIAEVALAAVLLVGAGLLGRSLQRLLEVDLGMQTEQVLTLRLTLAGPQYQEVAALRNFINALLPRLESLPGVRSAGGVMYLPLSGEKIGHTFSIDDRPPWREGEEPSNDLRPIAGDYFGTLGIPLLRGRTFNDRDTENSPPVFIINQELARQHFPDRDPIGKRISYEWDSVISGEIVGIVGSIREMGPTEKPAAAIYVPFAQMPMTRMTMLVRADGDPLGLVSAVRAAVRETDPNQPVADIRSLDQVAGDTVARPRLNLYLLGGFAGVALLLAALGIYGVVSYSVTQRREEIGVRVALGAQRGDVLGLILRQGMGLTVVGLLIGILSALFLTRLMATMLFGIGASDPLTLAGVSAFLAAVALLATCLPAWRAARVDPTVALRVQ